MKRTLIFAAVASLFAGAALVIKADTDHMKPAQDKTDGNGHVLVSLWKEYDAAAGADRPQKQAAILEKIIAQASDKRLSKDFYDAACAYEEVVRSRNWKLRDSLASQLAGRVREYDDPLVTFEHMRERQGAGRNDLKAYVLAEKKRLLTSRSQAFYKANYMIKNAMDECLADRIGNDYEYALWACVLSGGDLREDAAQKELAQALGGNYPCAAFLEYKVAASIPYSYDNKEKEKRKALEAVAEKYKGKAIGLYPAMDILREDFNLADEETDRQEVFLALMDRAEALEKERKAFSGSEALLVENQTWAKDLMDILQNKDIQIRVNENGEIVLTLRNLPSAEVSITAEGEKKPFYTKTLANPKRSFYVHDVLKTALPPMDDGTYAIRAKNGKTENATTFESYRLSAATRRSSAGYGIYIADHKSGEPLKKADIELSRNGKPLTAVKDFPLGEGFTPLPESIGSLIGKDRDRKELTVSAKDAEGKLMRSSGLGIGGRIYDEDYALEDIHQANIYLDRGAFNPSDTVRFKAILYKGDMVNAAAAAPEGTSAKVSILDSEGNVLETKTLETNGFGSLAGSFTLPADIRGGDFAITLESGEWHASTHFSVDEFVLPTFDMEFDPVERLFFPGDSIEVKGKVKTYSGHNISDATVAWKVLRGNEIFASGKANPDAEGAFSIGFRADEGTRWSWYEVNVTVTDGTGETHEFNKGVWVTSHLNVGIDLHNSADGVAAVASGKESLPEEWRYVHSLILASGKAEVKFNVTNNDGHDVPVPVSWSLLDWDGKVIKEAESPAGETVDVDMTSLPAGNYTFKAKTQAKSSSGKEYEGENSLSFIKIAKEDKALHGNVRRLFTAGETTLETGENISVRAGTTQGSLWAVAEIFGENRRLLSSKAIYLEGKEGTAGSVEDLSFRYMEDWPDAVNLRIFYFKDSGQFSFQRTYRRKRHTLDLPLSFSSFEDRTLPSTEYTFKIKTAPGAECLAAVFDKSVESIRRNWWNTVSLMEFNVPYVEVDAICGRVGGHSVPKYRRMMTKGAALSRASVNMMAVEEDDGAVLDSPMAAVSYDMAMESAEAESVLAQQAGADVKIREDFATTLAFEPFLRSDENGDISLKFKTSDKLSTFVVSLYAHTPLMRNALLRRETVVSIPVKVSITEPGYLYSGDSYSASVSVSSNSDAPVSGRLFLYRYDGKTFENTAPADVKSLNITVPARGTTSHVFEVDAPRTDSEEKIMGLKAVFVADDFSDGVFVTVPVRPSAQVITESHSAVVLPGADEEALLEKIRSAFVNVSPYGAEYKEISIIDMVREAIPSKAEPSSDNVLDLSEAFYVRKVAATLGAAVQEKLPTDKLWEKILSCRNADGGFSWFQGMQSSPVITAVLLERFAKLSKAGLLPEINLDDAVRFLDQNQFDMSRPYWCGGLGDWQYMLVRSLYPEVPFNVRPRFMESEFNKRLKDFRKDAKEYLVPGKVRGMNGRILAKARRIRTLSNLLSSQEGIALAKSWGVSFSAPSKLRKSLEADIVSLLEYAVDHPDGGMYYPNAVMPYRGLLESEAYAHSLICDLLTQHGAPQCLKTADGIRIWLMLQKETQKWGEEPAFVDALNSILEGSDEVKATKVILMSKTYEKPFSEIKAAGNGFTIERKLFRAEDSEGKEILTEIKPGQTVRKGEKLIAEYKIWNQENRSFVVVNVPREAAFRPVNQLSGRYGFGIRPLRVNGWYTFTPGGYRSVKTDRSQFYFDSYPEENTTLREEFFATQTGVYTAPVVSVESLYAPHYRANGGFGGEVKVAEND